jgi:hypothetical protein
MILRSGWAESDMTDGLESLCHHETDALSPRVRSMADLPILPTWRVGFCKDALVCLSSESTNKCILKLSGCFSANEARVWSIERGGSSDGVRDEWRRVNRVLVLQSEDSRVKILFNS